MLFEMTVPQSKKMLHNLSQIMTKAEAFAVAKKIDPEVLLNFRLAPDQFNFIRQVQIACDMAKLGVARLTGKESPVHNDTEKTIPELKARIESTIGFLNDFSAKDFVGAEERKVTTPRWEGKWLTGSDYAHSHMMPNLYFHVTTAYSILRHNGVEIGKKDYLGEVPYRT